MASQFKSGIPKIKTNSTKISNIPRLQKTGNADDERNRLEKLVKDKDSRIDELQRLLEEKENEFNVELEVLKNQHEIDLLTLQDDLETKYKKETKELKIALETERNKTEELCGEIKVLQRHGDIDTKEPKSSDTAKKLYKNVLGELQTKINFQATTTDHNEEVIDHDFIDLSDEDDVIDDVDELNEETNSKILLLTVFKLRTKAKRALEAQREQASSLKAQDILVDELRDQNRDLEQRYQTIFDELSKNWGKIYTESEIIQKIKCHYEFEIEKLHGEVEELFVDNTSLKTELDLLTADVGNKRNSQEILSEVDEYKIQLSNLERDLEHALNQNERMKLEAGLNSFEESKDGVLLEEANEISKETGSEAVEELQKDNLKLVGESENDKFGFEIKKGNKNGEFCQTGTKDVLLNEGMIFESTKVSEMKQENQILLEEIEKLRKEVKNLSETAILDKKRSEITSFEGDKVTEMEKENKILSEEIEKLRKQVENLSENLDTSTKVEISDHKTTKQGRNLLTTEQQNTESKDKTGNTSLEQELTPLKQFIKESDKDIEKRDMKGLLDIGTEKVEELNLSIEKYNEIQNQNKLNVDKIQKLLKDNEINIEKIENLEIQVEETEELKMRLKNVYSEMEGIKNQNSICQSTIKSLEEKIAEKDRLLIETAKNVEIREAKLKECNLIQNKNREEIENLYNKKTSFEEKLQNREKEIKEKELALEEAKVVLDGKTKEYSELQRRFLDLKEKMDKDDAMLEEKSKQIDEVEKKVFAFERKIMSLEREKLSLVDKNTLLVKQNKENLNELNKLREQITEYQVNLEDRNDTELLKSSVNSVEKEKDCLLLEVEKLKLINSQLEMDKDRLKSENKHLNEHFDRADMLQEQQTLEKQHESYKIKQESKIAELEAKYKETVSEYETKIENLTQIVDKEKLDLKMLNDKFEKATGVYNEETRKAKVLLERTKEKYEQNELDLKEKISSLFKKEEESGHLESSKSTQNQKLSSDIESLKKELEKTSKDLKKEREEKFKMEKLKDSLRVKLEELQASFDLEREEMIKEKLNTSVILEEEKQQIFSTMKDYEIKNDKLASDVEQASNSLKTLKEKYSKLKEKYRKLNKKYKETNELNQSNEQAEADENISEIIQNLKESKEATIITNTKLVKEATELRSQLTNVEQKLKATRKANVLFMKQTRCLYTESLTAQETENNNKAKIQNLQDAIIKLRGHEQAWEAEKTVLKEKLDVCEQENKRLKETYHGCIEERNVIQDDLKLKNKDYTNLCREFQRMREENGFLERQVTQLKEELDVARTQNTTETLSNKLGNGYVALERNSSRETKYMGSKDILSPSSTINSTINSSVLNQSSNPLFTLNNLNQSQKVKENTELTNTKKDNNLLVSRNLTRNEYSPEKYLGKTYWETLKYLNNKS